MPLKANLLCVRLWTVTAVERLLAVVLAEVVTEVGAFFEGFLAAFVHAGEDEYVFSSSWIVLSRRSVPVIWYPWITLLRHRLLISVLLTLRFRRTEIV